MKLSSSRITINTGQSGKREFIKKIKTSPFSGIIKMRLAILQIST